jgi:hypothetical protein
MEDIFPCSNCSTNRVAIRRHWMKKTSSPTQYPASRLKGLHASTQARKQETVQRLYLAIESLKAKKQAITSQSILIECGLHYTSYARNPEALALFHANSSHLNQQRKRNQRKRPREAEPVSPRDPLLNYSKPQLVTRLGTAMERIQELERQQATLLDACLQGEARVRDLEGKLAELEPYRSFVEGLRSRVHREEQGGTLPPC